MSYIIYTNSGTVLTTVATGKFNTNTTSLTLVGRNVSDYGQVFNQNLVGLLTNFASPTYIPPQNPIEGQLWYDTTVNKLKVFNNGSGFDLVNFPVISDSQPVGQIPGDFWYDPTEETLNFLNSDGQYVSTIMFPKNELSGWAHPHTAITDANSNTAQVSILKNYGRITGVLTTAAFTASYADSIGIFAEANTSSLEVVDGLTIFGDIKATEKFVGNLVGDIYAENRVSKILDNGTDGTDATFTGDVTGNLTGNVTGNLLGDSTGTHYGSVVGNASSADKWSTPRTITLQNEYMTGTVVIDGSQDVTLFAYLNTNTNLNTIQGTENQIIVNNTGAGYFTVSLANDVVISGNLTVIGSSTQIQSTTLVVEDKNIQLAFTNPDVTTDALADGGGITLHGTTDKTILWDLVRDKWIINPGIDVQDLRVTSLTGNELVGTSFYGDLISYTLGTGLTLSSTTINHSNSVEAATAQEGGVDRTLAFGGTFNIPKISFDTEGHITYWSTTTLTLPTYSAGTGLTLNGTTFDHTNSTVAATASESGSSRTLAFGGTFNIPSITYDAQGHITTSGYITLTMPPNPDTDLNTTYTISAETVSGGANLRLTGSDSTTDNVKLAQGSNVTITRTDADTITIASSYVDTTYSAGTGLTLSGTTFNHTNSVAGATASESGSSRTLAFGGTFNVPSVTYDDQGHITTSSSVTLTLPANPDTNTTYSLSAVDVTGAKAIRLTDSSSNNSDVNIAAGSNVTITRSGNTLTIASSYSDTNTTYSAGTGLTLNGTTFDHTNSVAAGTASESGSSRTLTFGGTFKIPSVTYDAQGHITTSGSITLTMPANPDTNTTYSAGSGLTLSGTTFSHTNAIVASTVADGGATRTLSFGGTFKVPTINFDAQGHITSTGTITLTMPASPADNNTTYGISAETVSGGANLRLTGSDSTTDNVKLASGSNVTITRTDADTITIESSYTDTNTTYGISAETVAGGANLRLTGSDSSTDNVSIVGGPNVTVTRTDANTITIDANSGGGGGTPTIPPSFFKAFEVLADNVYDVGAGTTTIVGNTRYYQLDFSVSDTTRPIRYFFPYITVDSAYTVANGRLVFQYATTIAGKTTPIYTNGTSANFYTNGTTAPIYTDTTYAWTDIGDDVFVLPFSTGVNSVRAVIIGDGVNPTTFSDFIVKAFMPATTEYSRQTIGGLSTKAITFNNVFESVNHITITLNYQGYAWVTNQTNTGVTLNFSTADSQGVAYVAISGY